MTIARPYTVALEQALSLGGVVSCLPLAAVLKERLPGVRVVFIAKPHTQALVDACTHIDEFLDISQVLEDPDVLARRGIDAFISPLLNDACGRAALRARIPLRVGNILRLRTYAWANRFIYQATRHSPKHIIDLNLSFLRPLGIDASCPSAATLGRFGLDRIPVPNPALRYLLDRQRFNLILHPKSNRNSRKWPLEYFCRLIEMLPANRFNIILTGLQRERGEVERDCPALLTHSRVIDLMGRLRLTDLLGLIDHSDGLVSNGSGPLYIAAALGIHALGLYPGRERANPHRWGPVGIHAEGLSVHSTCSPGSGRCAIDYDGGECSCLIGLSPLAVAQKILNWSRLTRPRIIQ